MKKAWIRWLVVALALIGISWVLHSLRDRRSLRTPGAAILASEAPREEERSEAPPRAGGGPAPAARESAAPQPGNTNVSEPPRPEAGRAPGSAVRARFVDRRAPLEGVELGLVEDPAASVLSGPDGTVRLGLAESLFAGAARSLTLEARRSGFALEHRRVRVEPGQELLLGDWTLVAAGSVEGRVVDEGGQGLAAIQVACLREGLASRDLERRRRAALEELWRPGARTTTAADGSFRLDDVPAGEIRLVAVAEERPAAVSESLEVPAGGVASGVFIAMEAADGGTLLEGIVLDPRGGPVAFAPYVVRAKGTEHASQAGPDGRFQFRCDDKQPRDLTAFDPERQFREATRLGVLPGTRDLELRLSVAPEVALAVHAQDGMPIERFAVAVIAEDGSRPLAFVGEEQHPRGRFAVAAPGEDFRIEVRANGWLPGRFGPFRAADPPREVDCRLAPARGVRGRVTAAGEPVPGARVALHAAVRENDTYNGFPLRLQPSPAIATESDAAGAFSLSVEERGSYHLLVEAQGYALAEHGPLALDPDSDEEVAVELDGGGALAVRVRSSAGASVAGLVVAFSRGDGRARTARTDERGELELQRLAPGPWQVQLAEREIVPGSGAHYFGTKPAGAMPSNCRVFAGQVTRVDLWLEDQGEHECRLTGRLTIDGRPAEGWVAALDREREVVLDGQAFLEPGLFRIGADVPGSYRLRLSPQASDPSATLVILDAVELFEGERYWSLDLETGGLEGTLAAGADGKLVFHRWQRGTLECFAPLVPTPEGAFRCSRAAAGRGTLVRLDPSLPMEEQTPVVLCELTVDPGKTVAIDL